MGGDDRVREAHRQAVTIALTELERYTQARIGGNNPAETTGKFIVAKFEHDTARPVDGYAAPQLHIELSIPTTDFIAEVVIGPSNNPELSLQAVQAFFKHLQVQVDVKDCQIPFRNL